MDPDLDVTPFLQSNTMFGAVKTGKGLSFDNVVYVPCPNDCCAWDFKTCECACNCPILPSV